ncbi:Reverse transcriptase domain-containing protein, partial [Aphis craccivora]
MGKVQYAQNFRVDWLRQNEFKSWLKDVTSDSSKAFCKICCFLRIHPPNTIKPTITSLNTSRAEVALAMFVSAHCALLSVDHLGALCKSHFSGTNNTADNLHLHHDIGNGRFSILVDESTDISVIKYLGIAAIYYSTFQNKIVTTFFGLEELVECNAAAIVKAILNALKSYELDIKNVIGIGTDNASVMLATSYACSETMPRNLDFLISETYNWFSKSTLRQQAYRHIFKVMNDDHEPLKIVQACNTRWLSIESAVVRIIDQWHELKCHFDMKKNLVFLLFLRPLLSDLQRVNKLFESNSVDPTKLVNELVTLICSIGKLFVIPTFNFNPITKDFSNFLNPNPYLSYGFEKKVEELRNLKLFTNLDEKNLRSRCISFATVLVKQLQKWIPENLGILQKFGLDLINIEKIEMQWRKINLITWSNTSFAGIFWAEVKKFKDASGSNPFEELADFAFMLLALPFSNAAVEKVFSQMNLVKTKTSNRMGSNLLISILHIRSGLKRHEKCCDSYVIPDTVLHKIGTKESYINIPENELAIFEDLPI